MIKRILITGADGQLGQCLIAEAANMNHIQLLPLNHQQLDVTNAIQVEQCLLNFKPDIVINCAAFTAVDKAESEPDKANAVNKDAVESLARVCHAVAAILVHISTDYVFSGDSKKPYTELDRPAPINVYGRSKFAAEQVIAASPVHSIVVRTGWLYSEFSNNFFKTIIRRASHSTELNVVADQFGTPTYARHLANTLLLMLQHPEIEQVARQKKLYHFANQGVASWHEFASQIVKSSGSLCQIVPVTTANYKHQVGALAPRPLYSALDCSSISTAFSLNSIDWRTALENCMQNYEVA